VSTRPWIGVALLVHAAGLLSAFLLVQQNRLSDSTLSAVHGLNHMMHSIGESSCAGLFVNGGGGGPGGFLDGGTECANPANNGGLCAVCYGSPVSQILQQGGGDSGWIDAGEYNCDDNGSGYVGAGTCSGSTCNGVVWAQRLCQSSIETYLAE
jgi:hypothetical protein